VSSYCHANATVCVKLERSVVYHTGPAGSYTPQNYRISKRSLDFHFNL